MDNANISGSFEMQHADIVYDVTISNASINMTEITDVCRITCSHCGDTTSNSGKRRQSNETMQTIVLAQSYNREQSDNIYALFCT